MRGSIFVVGIAIAAVSCGGGADEYDESAPIESEHGGDLLAPTTGQLYHGVFPGHDISLDDVEGNEDDLLPADVDSYESTVASEVTWVYFSDNWYVDREFPLAEASWIRDRGAIPFIRLMLRHSEEDGDELPRTPFTLEDIIEGEFDDDLVAWGEAAADFGTPLIVEWGTEMNGEWFWWNGVHNGGDPDGPKLFVAAFRHIVRTICDAGASNTTWVFHAAAEDVPEEPWNFFESYYPGDDAVDWVGMSVYGAENPNDDVTSFRELMDDVVPRMAAIAPQAPQFVFEFGVATPVEDDGADWVDAALTDLVDTRWPEVRGFSWWNENWTNDDESQTVMRLQDLPITAQVFRDHLSAPGIVTSPLLPD